MEREPRLHFSLSSRSGNTELYKSDGPNTIYVKYVRNGDSGSSLTIASGGHVIGEYRNGKPVTNAPDLIFRKVRNSDLPPNIRSALDMEEPL